MKKVLNFMKNPKLRNFSLIVFLLFIYVFICAQNYVSAVSNNLSDAVFRPHPPQRGGERRRGPDEEPLQEPKGAGDGECHPAGSGAAAERPAHHSGGGSDGVSLRAVQPPTLAGGGVSSRLGAGGGRRPFRGGQQPPPHDRHGQFGQDGYRRPVPAA